ncbi:MAG: hypothetical protein AAF655_12895 [Bacteroidota bacterium]
MNPFIIRPAGAGPGGRLFLKLTFCLFLMGCLSMQQSQAQIIIGIEPPRSDSTNSLVVPADLVVQTPIKQEAYIHAAKQPGIRSATPTASSRRVSRKHSILLFWERWLLGLFR